MNYHSIFHPSIIALGGFTVQIPPAARRLYVAETVQDTALPILDNDLFANIYHFIGILPPTASILGSPLAVADVRLVSTEYQSVDV